MMTSSRQGYLIALIGQLIAFASCQQQYFRVVPKNTTVQEGGEVTLECEVSNLAGTVQWTKDGFALGFQAIIPGFPSYTRVGDTSHGVYNLRIRNVSLTDDAEFQCQVGPAQYHKPIRANARLTVITPPSSIEIVGHPSNSKIEIRENQEITLECLVKNAKPAAKIVWYRGNTELKLDNRQDQVSDTEERIGHTRVHRASVSSKIRIKPSKEDDFAEYTCEATHEALPVDMPMRTTVQLSVMYPPDPPYIEGYTEGETIKRSQNVELVCRSRGGNPPPQLTWYRNDEIRRVQYRTSNRMSESTLSFTAEAADNKAKFRCEASNVMSHTPLKTELTLSVFFAPAQVSITGTKEARVGDVVPLTCTTAPSNPPAQITWQIGGAKVRNATQNTQVSSEGGWTTSSNTSITITGDMRNLVVVCYGHNKQLTEHATDTHTISVLYPPGTPIITGYETGTHLAAGTIHKISCLSSGGNPLANLVWYKNDKKINSVSKTTDKNTASAELTLLVNVTDNEAIYKCEASNAATEIPLLEEVKFSVHFPPDHVHITRDPENLRAGTQATLTCDSSSSNPPAQMSWYREGLPVLEGVKNTTKPGLHGGVISSISLGLNITNEINGISFTCQATNPALQRSINDAVELNVMYKPVFQEDLKTHYVGTEGSGLIISMPARGHPAKISYTWTKDRAPLLSKQHLSVEGNVLNMTLLNRSDAGSYSVEAVNIEGAATMFFNVTVHYPARISNKSDTIVVSQGDTAELWCQLDGSPLLPEHVTWRRPHSGSNLEGAVLSFKNNIAYLTLSGVEKKDMGAFECSVFNGLGNRTRAAPFLVVKHEPAMVELPHLMKAASNRGENAKLVCRASAAPKPNFKWYKKDVLIQTNGTQRKYTSQVTQLNPVTYESVLTIHNIENSDYGTYSCFAKNSLGQNSTNILFTIISRPDPPTQLSVLNMTHSTVTLAWVPGFDGGEVITYHVRYRVVGSSTQQYYSVRTENATSCVLGGLQLGTQYEFSVIAANKIGDSDYSDTVQASTSSLPEAILMKADVSLSVILGIALSGALLVLLNIFLIAVCIHRKRIRRGTSEQSSKTATIEMYAPSSFNETVTGETLSSVSEKSETYSEHNQDYGEENRKTATSTYLIEQMDYPFQYPGYDIQPPHHGLKDMQPTHHGMKDSHMLHPQENMNMGTLHRNNYATQNGTLGRGLSSGVDSNGYFNSGPDPRYVAYPPPVQFAQPPLLPQPLSLRVNVPPPDVTVLGAPGPHLTTFYGGGVPLENEGHLV
uniref:Nephrin n=1 Tax=Cacopsylla melanoneura TaxID=428564 RepID=A0A8D9ETC5_9HEMI